jgi:hypothetical protein
LFKKDIYSICFDSNMKALSIIFILLLLSSSAIAAIPEWIQPGTSATIQSNCPEGEVGCFGRFWVDPDNPTASIKGETGVLLKVAEKGPFEHQGTRWDSTTLHFALPGRMETYIILAHYPHSRRHIRDHPPEHGQGSRPKSASERLFSPALFPLATTQLLLNK